MRRFGALAIGCWLALATARAEPGEILRHLRHGIAVTHWFRFPPDLAPQAMLDYLSGAQLRSLRAAGFDHVRLPVQPELLWDGARIDPARVALLARIAAKVQRAGLAVLVAMAPYRWQLERENDAARLHATWEAVAPALKPLDPGLLVVEPASEPVFANDAAGWDRLQAALLARVRQTLPAVTVMLTGADWGGVGGLLALRPVDDPNVLYSVHFYEPPVLTALGAFEPGLDHAALAHLPFPVRDAGLCGNALPRSDSRTVAVAAWYCAGRWDEAALAARLGAAARWAEGHRARVQLGEFGASAGLRPEARLAWLRSVANSAAESGFGWTEWGLDDTMGFDLRLPQTGDLILEPALLAALGLR